MLKFVARGLLAVLLLAAPVAYADDISNGSWSTTDGSNTAAPPNGWPAGMFPNQVEPSARAGMGGTKRWWERANAGISTTGSAGAYVLTPTNTSYPTAYTQGEIYCAKSNFTSVGNDTLNVNGLGAKALYNNLARIGAGSIQSGQQFCGAYDGALNSGAGGFQLLSGVPIANTLPTRQVLTSGSTYSTPAGARQLRIKMVGAGGGGGSGGSNGIEGVTGSNGGNTSFNSIVAVGGRGGSGGTDTGNVFGGAGGTGGSGSASFRSTGGGGIGGALGAVSSLGATGGAGGSSALGGGANGANSGSSNPPGYGGGGSGADVGNQGYYSGAGGGGGEYVEIIINAPSTTYSYSIGSGGAGGNSARIGNPGTQGVIIVDELY